VLSGDGAFGQLDWKLTQDGRGPLSREDFEKAMLVTPAPHVLKNAAALDACLVELQGLTNSLNARMGGLAPGLGGIQEALEACRTINRRLQQLTGASEGSGQPPTTDGQAARPTPTDGMAAAPQGEIRPAATRAEAYRQLAQAASLLQEIEPHSPIPYLVRRAVELGSLPFPELIRRLIRDGNVLNELNRELGIKEPESSTSE
jgi:type VI secretion system protein ImpA